MGHSPSVKKILDRSGADTEALKEAINKAALELGQKQSQAETYVNSNTKGIARAMVIKVDQYSKFADETDLKTLDSVIDGLSNLAKGQIRAKGFTIETIDAIAQIAKAVVAIFTESANVSANEDLSFYQFSSGDANYAVYHAVNSMEVTGEDAWGGKSIIVCSNCYLLAQVNPDPAVNKALEIQNLLNSILKLDDALSAAIVKDAEDGKSFDNLEHLQKGIRILRADLKKHESGQ